MTHAFSLYRLCMMSLSGLLFMLTLCGGCKSAPDTSSTTSQPTLEPMSFPEQRTYSLKLDNGHTIIVGVEGHEELAPAPGEVDQVAQHVLIYMLTVTRQGMPTSTHRYLASL